MAIDLANVDISLQEFQRVASGKYNAGEVRLLGEHKLEKINNHVLFKGKNNVSLSHEEVLAIKTAFIDALARGGLDAALLNEIRAELGLAPKAATDTTLMARSLKPLSRQQIRDILDRYSEMLAEHGTRIRTSGELFARVSQAKQESRAAKRAAVNGALDRQRATKGNPRVARLQAVVGGMVDFQLGAERDELLSEAQDQLASLLRRCGGQPSAERPAQLEITLPNGQTIVMGTKMNELEYARKLDDEIIRLRYGLPPSQHDLDVRAAFQSLGQAERLAWLANAGNTAASASEVRTVAVMLLQERGVSDYATLSRLNQAPIAAVLGFVRQLVEAAPAQDGAAVRQMVLDALVPQINPQALPAAQEQAFIPATSPSLFNRAARELLCFRSGLGSPFEFQAFADETVALLRGRFGEAIVPPDATFGDFSNSGLVCPLIRVDGEGDPDIPVERARMETLREPLTKMAVSMASRTALEHEVKAAIQRLGAGKLNPRIIANGINRANPTLVEAISNCKSPSEVSAVLDTARSQIEAAVRRNVEVTRCKNSFIDFVREVVSAATGIPISCIGEEALPETRLHTIAYRLAEKIDGKNIPVEKDEDIEMLFRDEARAFAAERASLFMTVDMLELSAETKADLKGWLLAQEKVNYLDMNAIVSASAQIGMKEVADALKAGAPKEAVYRAMTQVMAAVAPLADTLLEGKLEEVGSPEHTNVITTMFLIAFDAVPGIREDLAAFLERPEVRADLENGRVAVNNPAFGCVAFLRFAAPQAEKTNAAIVDGLGSGRLSAINGLALVQAARDVGLDQLTPAEVLALFAPTAPSGKILAEAVGASPVAITPAILHSLAYGALKPLAGTITTERVGVRLFLDGVGAQQAQTAGYHSSELPALARAFALFQAATGCNETTAIAAVLDPHSPARRLMDYGGRFTESVQNFKRGLALLDKFQVWYKELLDDVEAGKQDTPTQINFGSYRIDMRAARAVEKFLFEEIAVNGALNLDAEDPNEVFDMENNAALRFVGRGYTESFTNSLAQIPPKQRHLFYTVFDALDPLSAGTGGKGVPPKFRHSVILASRVLKNFDAVAALRSAGQLDRAHLVPLLFADLAVPPNATNTEICDAFDAKMREHFELFGPLYLLMQDTGATIGEGLEAIRKGERLPPAPWVSSFTGHFEELDGTPKGGRNTMVGDLLRPSNPVSVATKQHILSEENKHFVFHFPDGETLVAKPGLREDEGVLPSCNAIADKIEALCGAVHPKQLSGVYFALSQSGIGGNIMGGFKAQGINSNEHMAVTFTLERNAETGAVIITCSEPQGFPFHFHWTTTVALDGSSTSTPMVIEGA